jgi:hypothetical protein
MRIFAIPTTPSTAPMLTVMLIQKNFLKLDQSLGGKTLRPGAGRPNDYEFDEKWNSGTEN